jgi:hypothetical protein
MIMTMRNVAVVGVGFVLTLIAASTGSTDEVTLRNGGVLRGKITKSGANLAVTTSQGIRVVVERSAVQKIDRKSSESTAKVPLSDGEKAWVAKVRKLIRRAENADSETGARAIRDLRSINDPAAVPALMQTLRTSDLETSRLLYVRILGDMPGSKAVLGLVEEALFDSSPLVRDAAQEASKKQRPEYVRPYYGQALRFPNREVICRAANVLGTVGNRENVPYLIDSLYSKTVDVAYRPSCCMSRVAYLANPHGNSYIQDNLVPRGDGTYTAYHEGLRPVLVVRNVENPQVKDALEAITKQAFGYNTVAWRRWWKSEQLADSGSNKAR